MEADNRPRARCARCGARWPGLPAALEGGPSACPGCGVVAAHLPEPLDQGWWGHFTGQAPEAVEAALDAEAWGCARD